MHSKHARMRVLESYAQLQQRKTLGGLITLVQTGKLSVTELTDEELGMIIAHLPGDVDLRHLSDAELEAILQ